MSSYSVVVPVYGCHKSLVELCERVTLVLSNYTFEIILVDDSDSSETWHVIENICSQNNHVKGVQLSRNFGQHYAITCGLKYITKEWVIVMDCDLQDTPEEIPTLITKKNEGFEIVLARRHERKDSFFKKLGSKIFYNMLGYLTNTKQDQTIANFGIYHKKVIEAVLSMKDQIRYFPTMIQWVGFKKISVNVRHSERNEGKSAYSIKGLINLAFNNIIAFSDKPLRLTIKMGTFISCFSLLVGLYYLVLYLNGEIIQIGFTSLILSIWFLSGTIIIILGIIGIYVGKTFEKVKERPVYIVSNTLNLDQLK